MGSGNTGLVRRCHSNHGISRGTKEKPRRGRRGFLPRTVSTGAGGLEGPTVRMINAHVVRQFRVDPADRAIVSPHVRGASVRAAQSKISITLMSPRPRLGHASETTPARSRIAVVSRTKCKRQMILPAMTDRRCLARLPPCLSFKTFRLAL